MHVWGSKNERRRNKENISTNYVNYVVPCHTAATFNEFFKVKMQYSATAIDKREIAPAIIRSIASPTLHQ